MSNNTTKGIDVRQTGTALVFRAFLQSSAGALIISGTTNLYIMELQSDGTIATYDFSSNTFKTGAVTTEFSAMSYKKSNNATTDTGLWTLALATLTGFTVGAIYLVRVNNSGAFPTDQMREFQFGSDQGDLTVINVSTGLGDLQVTPDFSVALPVNPVANSLGEALFASDIQLGRINVAQAGTSTTITLDAGASAVVGSYVGDGIYLYGGTGGGIRGSGQLRSIIAYNTSTKVATVDRAWGTTPDNTTKFMTMPLPRAVCSQIGLDNISVESGMNARQAFSVIASACGGQSSGVSTGSPVYKAANDPTTTRITATASNGDRSSVTLTLPA